MNLFSGLLAQVAVSTNAPTASSPFQSLFGNQYVFFAVVAVMMFFLLIRPQQQRAKQQQKLLSTLKSGDRVSTASGLVGVVISVKDKAVPPTVSLRSADAKFEILKSSVTEILESSTATTAIES